MRRFLLCLGIVGLVAGSVGVSQAVDVGAEVAWHDDVDLGFGARVGVPMEALHENVSLVGEFLIFFPGDDYGVSGLNVDVDSNYFEINGNLLYDFALEGSSFIPYAGAGLNFARISVSSDYTDPLGNNYSNDISDSELGINILGGVQIPMDRMNPFVEAKIELGGGEAFMVTFGANFSFGGGGE